MSKLVLAANADDSILLIGETIHFEILNECESLLFDGTFDSIPLLDNHIMYEQQWLIHAVKVSYEASEQSESFPTKTALMMRSRGKDYGEPL